ncbi:HNH endonuclease [Aeromonas veronii]|uniref:HNH endonuclease n=1 Tax=Aeromonas veronii TaxID=654 RepID=UPI00226CEC13|nr:HNH endonuclease [Aeromonas veronii]MCX9112659.1 HNH endonuclease [Aeromonas veronii]
MAFWWVNHKQTYSAEVGGGYIWSPKKNRNGSKNQTYINLTLARPGDVVISYASGLIKAIGLVSASCNEKSKPSEFGSAGDSWSDTGWEVPINWERLSKPMRPKDHLELIAPLLPSKNSPLRPSGDGNQSCYLAGISDELGNLLLSLTPTLKLLATSPTHKVIQEFKDQEEEYLAWVEENPDGFVANMDKAGVMKQYPMIHSAGDAAISKDKRGNFTTNAYFKICSTDLQELRSYLKHKYHRFTYCMKCFETLEEQREHDDEAAIAEIQHSPLTVTEKEQLVKSRRGQGLFRSRLEQIEPSCRVTGVSNKVLLIASHIKPWCECDNIERLDGNNGLLLSPHIDKLFDQGWITFTDAGGLLCAEPSIERALQQWGVELPINVGPFKPKQSEYLAYHRSKIYRSAPTSE